MRRSSWMPRFACLVMLVPLLAGCMRPSAVWVEPGSTRENLRFSIGKSLRSHAPIDNLNFVRVSACGVGKGERTVRERVLWLASGFASPDALAGTFAYGSPPHGLVTRRAPEDLRPGCYVIDISGEGISAAACFEVDGQGVVRPSSSTTLECQVRGRAS